MNYNTYIYGLAKGNKKFTCPACGRAKCFKQYVNNQTGEIIHESVGRCDHEQSCQYHYTPKQFFQDHPEARIKGIDTVRVHNLTATPPQAQQTEEKQSIFYPKEWAEQAAMRQSVFSRWFLSLPFDDYKKADVLMAYYVGATKDDIIIQGTNYGPAVIFWMIDEQQRPHDAKMMAYTCDGHRVPDWGNYLRSYCVKRKVGPQVEHTDKVLFGQHLLPRYPDKAVCIVESEKTALICACKYPDYLWLATGGCGNLNPEKIKPLMHRHLIIYPDSGECNKWRKQMEASGHQNYRIEDFIEQYPPNTDIADIILGHIVLNGINLTNFSSKKEVK